MRKGLLACVVAVTALLLGTACGAHPTAQARYVYYPAPDQQGASTDSGTDGTLPADTADDPTPVDYVNAGPAATTQAAPATAPTSPGFGAPNAIGRVEIPKIGMAQPMFEGVGLDVLA